MNAEELQKKRREEHIPHLCLRCLSHYCSIGFVCNVLSCQVVLFSSRILFLMFLSFGHIVYTTTFRDFSRDNFSYSDRHTLHN